MSKLREKTVLAFGKKGERKMLALSPLVLANEEVDKNNGRGHLLEEMHKTLSRKPVHYLGEVFSCNVMSGYIRGGLYHGGNAVQISVEASTRAEDISMMLFGQPGQEYEVYDHTACKWYRDGQEYDKSAPQPA